MKYDQLEKKELRKLEDKGIINQCGSTPWWRITPQFIFKTSCKHHDFNYWKGGTKEDRRRADLGLFSAMVEDLNETSEWKEPLYLFFGYIYYRLVRTFGRQHFSYRKKPKTWRHLDALLTKK